CLARQPRHARLALCQSRAVYSLARPSATTPRPLPFAAMEIHGRVALVTGGARRLGRELALALARAGADVVINYFRSAAEAEATVQDIVALGRRAVAVHADVGRAADVTALIQ